MSRTKIFVEGMTLRDISKKYGISIDTVRARYVSGKRTLKELSRTDNLRGNEYHLEIAVGGGKRVLMAMIERHLTLAELGRRTGLPWNTIWEYIYNGRDISSNRLAKICQVCGCSMDYVMGLKR